MSGKAILSTASGNFNYRLEADPKKLCLFIYFFFLFLTLFTSLNLGFCSLARTGFKVVPDTGAVLAGISHHRVRAGGRTGTA